MKILKLIYNPKSGDKHFKNALDDCVDIFQNAGYEVHLLRAVSREMLDGSIANTDADSIVIAGGDGTVNIAVNSLMRHNKNIPIGIIPAGTANDFSLFLKMPKDPRSAAKAIAEGNIIDADLGLANDRYFINVCGAGMLANVSQKTDTNFKDALGKLAYYLKGLGQLPNLTPLPLRITAAGKTITDDFYLFLVLNSSGAGGFDKLSVNAKINDGLLDFVGFKAKSLIDAAALFLKVFTGDYLDDSRVVFFREPELFIENLDNNQKETDTDGEPGPDMPLKIVCIKNAVKIFVPKNFLR